MHELNIVKVLLELVVILLSAKLFGELAERWGQPAVLGELLGGVILGFGFFTFFEGDHGVEPLQEIRDFGIVGVLRGGHDRLLLDRMMDYGTRDSGHPACPNYDTPPRVTVFGSLPLLGQHS